MSSLHTGSEAGQAHMRCPMPALVDPAQGGPDGQPHPQLIAGSQGGCSRRRSMHSAQPRPRTYTGPMAKTSGGGMRVGRVAAATVLVAAAAGSPAAAAGAPVDEQVPDTGVQFVGIKTGARGAVSVAGDDEIARYARSRAQVGLVSDRETVLKLVDGTPGVSWIMGYPMTEAEAKQVGTQLQIQNSLGAHMADFERLAGVGAGEIEIDHRRGATIVLHVKKQVDTTELQALLPAGSPQIEQVIVEFSRAEMSEQQRLVRESIVKRGNALSGHDVIGIGSDPLDGTVSIWLADADVEDPASVVADLNRDSELDGIKISLRLGAEVNANYNRGDGPPMQGGNQLDYEGSTSHNISCTSGFKAWQNGTPGYVTNGHCVSPVGLDFITSGSLDFAGEWVNYMSPSGGLAANSDSAFVAFGSYSTQVYWSSSKLIGPLGYYYTYGIASGFIVFASMGKTNATPQISGLGGDWYDYDSLHENASGGSGWYLHNQSGDGEGGQGGDSGSPVFEASNNAYAAAGLYWGEHRDCNIFGCGYWHPSWSMMQHVANDLGVGIG